METTLFDRYVNPYLGELFRSLSLDKTFVRGKGATLEDSDGIEYLDFVAGYGSVPFGHNHPVICQKVRDTLERSEPGLIQPSVMGVASELAARLVRLSPPGAQYVCFSNSGAEAVETALKACRAATGRGQIISTLNSFHGKTLGALSVTGAEKYQKAFGAPVEGHMFVPYGDSTALEAAMAQVGQQTAAVILEPIQGEGGINVPPPGYIQRARSLCDHYGALLIIDEIQTGLGRTGDIFAIESCGVQPDCLVIGKALSGGLVPIAACIMNQTAYSKEFALKHSSTFAGNTLACQVGLAVLELLEAKDSSILNNVKARGTQLKSALQTIRERYPEVVAEVRGEGLLLGLHFHSEQPVHPGNWGTFIRMLASQDCLVPFLASHLLNVEKIRVAPTLNRNSVLRIEPPLTITDDECKTFLVGLERAIALLAKGNTGELTKHLTPNKRPWVSGRFRSTQTDSPDGLQPKRGKEERRFAFLVHPIDATSLVDFDESLRIYSPHELMKLGERLCQQIEPFFLASTRIKSKDGTTAYGEFIAVPRLPHELIQMPSGEAKQLIQKSVALAHARGAQIVGLGGYTSVVTRGGSQVAHEGVALTTGNSYTVIAGMEAIDLACVRLRLALSELNVAVVGAGGTIGSAIMRLMIHKVGGLTLIGNPQHPQKTKRRLIEILKQGCQILSHETDTGELGTLLRGHPAFPDGEESDASAKVFAERIIEENGKTVPITWSTDIKDVLPRCQVIVIATNSTATLIQPEDLCPGAIICDLSRPSNVSRMIKETRPDVLVIDGGIIEVPGRPHLGWNFGFPRGVVYACMAETIMLSLEGHFEDTSIGINLNQTTLALVQRLANKHGFKLSGLRSFDRPLVAQDWKRLLEHNVNTKGRKMEDKTDQHDTESQSIQAHLPLDAIDSSRQDNINFYLLDRHILANRGEHVALIEGERKVSYDEIFQRTQQAAAKLLALGIGPNDTVAIISYDSIAAVVGFLAIARIGATGLILNSFLRPNEFENFLQQGKAKAVLIGEHFRDMSERLCKTSRPCIELDKLYEHDLHSPASVPMELVRADTPVISLYSSGSTGKAKAVLHTHKDIINCNLNYAPSVLGLHKNDITFSTSKLFFAYGFNSVHFALFVGGTTVLAPRKADPHVVFDLINRHKPTVFFSVPTVYLLLLRKQEEDCNLKSVRVFVSAGEPLPEEIFEEWKMRFDTNIVDGIGTTEMLSTCISNYPDDLHPGSVGRVVPGFEVELRNENGDGTQVGEIGVLWVRSNTLTKGYWHDQEATIRYFRNGWFCSNDLFYRDSRNRFYFVGRANEVVKIGGCWISPRTLEEGLCQHNMVEECAVVLKNEIGMLVRPHAFVVLKDGVIPNECTADQLKAFAKSVLPPQHYPHFIEFLPALPRTETGKIKRHALLHRVQALPVSDTEATYNAA